MIVWQINKKDFTGKTVALPDGVDPKTYDNNDFAFRSTHAEAIEILETSLVFRMAELSEEQSRLQEIYNKFGFSARIPKN